ncbi:MAG: nuclear transport factor 2 family protein [Flavobacteriaceae bacterium]|nr:nuclear transport factor 2 family protein [Bacteroidia bacterium]NNF74967.1 nuclear transport factor 2 family protein [Flavobacteriaceae bacterium]NNK74228.1 nuclear transport factor 2 family protein [Flavobacteriaceae bacterium]NNL79668.1 nuclear transport factor 2 family protein [Flavobacteriaceae bacterium]
MFRLIFLVIFLILVIPGCKQSEQEPIHGRIDILKNDQVDSALYHELKAKDSLMFELSYNQLDFSILNELATEDIEFYHDQAGATYTKTDFINGMKGLGNLSYKARRELTEGSIRVFPMYNNGELYAAILTGEHRFFAKEPNDKPEYLTSSAKYTTLWILKQGEWKMSRIYSYDHRSP